MIRYDTIRYDTTQYDMRNVIHHLKVKINLPIIAHAENNIMFPIHVISGFPVNIVIGSNKSFSDEVHIFLGGFTFCPAEEDFSIDDGSFNVVHGLLVDAKHRTLDRGDGESESESESGDGEFHG